MRYLQKPDQPPDCITEFIQRQEAARALAIAENPAAEATAWESYPLNYGSFRSAPLLGELVRHQRGLCGYTGVAIDNRLARLQPDKPRRHWYMPHVEHLKPQSQCRAELEARDGIYGRDLCEDMDHRNMIAAIQVGGTPSEWFGAQKRANAPLPLYPTDPLCDGAFEFFEDGDIKGRTPGAEELINLLDLRHKTLRDWRKAALDENLPDSSDTQPADIQVLLDKLTAPAGPLPEFVFVLEKLARDYLAMHAARQA